MNTCVAVSVIALHVRVLYISKTLMVYLYSVALHQIVAGLFSH